MPFRACEFLIWSAGTCHRFGFQDALQVEYAFVFENNLKSKAATSRRTPREPQVRWLSRDDFGHLTNGEESKDAGRRSLVSKSYPGGSVTVWNSRLELARWAGYAARGINKSNDRRIVIAFEKIRRFGKLLRNP